MKKLAIIVTGHTRGFYHKWMEHVFPILEDIDGCNPHFFFQTWNNQFIPPPLRSNKFVMNNIAFEYETRYISETKYDTTLCQQDIYNEIKSIIKTDKSIIDSPYENLFNSKSNELADYASYVDLCNYYSQPFSWMKSYEKVKTYETDHAIKFDYVLKIRYDCFFRNSIKDIVNYFNTIDADFLHPSFSVWKNFKHPIDNTGMLPNGISDQWFICKMSDTSDRVMNNILHYMFKTNHMAISFYGRRYSFEQCFYTSLILLNAVLAEKYYDFLVIRNDWDFDVVYKNFKKYNITPKNEMTAPTIMNENLIKKINDFNENN